MRSLRSPLAVLLSCGAHVLATAQSTVRVSVDSAGIPSESGSGGLAAWNPSLSADGRFVLFSSDDPNLGGPPDRGAVTDTLVHGRATGITERVNVASDGSQSSFDAYPVGLSAEGRYVLFRSTSANLDAGDTNGVDDLFLRDRATGVTERVSIWDGGLEGSAGSGLWGDVSDDGRYVLFQSNAYNIVPCSFCTHVYLRDRQAGTTVLVTVTPSGAPSTSGGATPSLTADGRYAAFFSDDENVVAGDSNGHADVFVRDLVAQATELASVSTSGAQGNSASTRCALSDDGLRIAFMSDATNLVAGDTNGVGDVFVRDRLAGTTVRVGVGSLGAQSALDVRDPEISGDGRFVTFLTAYAFDAADVNATVDAYVRDLTLGTTELVSASSLGHVGATHVNAVTIPAPISRDGRFVAFSSSSGNLIAGDLNVASDVFLRDRASPVPPVTTYCTAKANSGGCAPWSTSSGEPTLTGNDAFMLAALRVLPNKSGIFFWGSQAQGAPFGGGTLCVKPPLVRSPLLYSGIDLPFGHPCEGAYSFHFRQSYMASQGLGAGDSLFGQFWSRDPGFAPPNNVGLSDAVSFTIAP